MPFAPHVPAADRLIARSVDGPGGCRLWTGYVRRDGYGQIRINYEAWYVHRLSYVTFVGPIPDGLVVDHLCFVPNCINVEHLTVTTNEANSRRNRRFVATHCKQGHEYTPDNTLFYGKGWRQCRTCRMAYRRTEPQMEAARVRMRARRAAKKQANQEAAA